MQCHRKYLFGGNGPKDGLGVGGNLCCAKAHCQLVLARRGSNVSVGPKDGLGVGGDLCCTKAHCPPVFARRGSQRRKKTPARGRVRRGLSSRNPREEERGSDPNSVRRHLKGGGRCRRCWMSDPREEDGPFIWVRPEASVVCQRREGGGDASLTFRTDGWEEMPVRFSNYIS